MIAVVNYGMGNIGSILNMVKKTGEKDVWEVETPEELYESDKIILPGVGAFDTAVSMIKEKGLWNVIREVSLQEKKPILGICLGMQLLGYSSEEGSEEGLGLIPFQCRKFRFMGINLKVPHMGWDYISIEQEECLLTRGISERARYYFVHSYYAVCENEKDILMKCDYGGNFAAAVHRDNIYGTQFHPEKSHRFGMELLRNFVREC